MDGYGHAGGSGGKPKLKGIKRDGRQGAGLESGTCHKEKIGNPDLGQGVKGADDGKAGAKPAGLGPKTKVSNGQVIW